MQIVIDIPEAYYEALKKTDVIVSGQRSGKTLLSVIYNAIANGIPLPKGHGRLIDADKLNRKRKYCFKTEHAWEALAYAETVVPADKDGDSDGNA